ncbi:MAG: OsmC family protein [Bacteroidetes bacterium]|nr:OsmC family protein [Bacteroidota bacterium]
MIKVQLSRVNGDFGFEAKDAYGNTVRLDSSPETGGENFGVRPMQMLLMGLGGCSGIDIVSILKKQRQTVTGFNMAVEGHREKGKEPALWENVHIVFELTGEIDPDKAKKACELSMDKYCSVAATLREAHCKITWAVSVNGQSLYSTK